MIAGREQPAPLKIDPDPDRFSLGDRQCGIHIDREQVGASACSSMRPNESPPAVAEEEQVRNFAAEIRIRSPSGYRFL